MAVDVKGNLFVWGMLDMEILEKPVLLSKNVTRISCGW